MSPVVSIADRNKVSPQEWQTRVDLAAAHRFAYVSGWEEDYNIFNHFTARVPGEPDFFLIKPHELTFGEVCASNLIKVNARGPGVGFEQNVNAPGFALHSGVLNGRPDLNTVLHLHSGPGTALSALACGLKMFSQDGMRFYNRISYHDYEGVAQPDEGPHLVRDLGKNDIMVLRNHGLLVCGPNIAVAAINLATLIHEAETQLRLLATGQKIVEPAAELCEQTARIFEASYRSPRPRPEWAAVLRLLERRDPSYRD